MSSDTPRPLPLDIWTVENAVRTRGLYQEAIERARDRIDYQAEKLAFFHQIHYECSLPIPNRPNVEKGDLVATDDCFVGLLSEVLVEKGTAYGKVAKHSPIGAHIDPVSTMRHASLEEKQTLRVTVDKWIADAQEELSIARTVHSHLILPFEI